MQSKKYSQLTRDGYLKLINSADVYELFSGAGSRSEGVRGNERRRELEGLDLKSTLREVHKYAASGLTGRSRRKHEEEQVVALGGKPSKPQKMPYPLYQKLAKARKEKERQRILELKLAGMDVPKKKNKKEQNRGRGRWRESLKGLNPHIGVVQGGTLKLTKKDLEKVKSTKKPRYIAS